MLDVTISGPKTTFFDSPQIIKKVKRGTRKALSKIGAFVRQTSKTSIRYGKKMSRPGQPPTARRGRFKRSKTNKKTGITKTQSVSPLREFIFFAYESERESVVIGPAIYRSGKRKNYLVAKALEQGETVRAVHRGNVIKPTKIRARPFMKPALDKEMPKFQSQFANIM